MININVLIIFLINKEIYIIKRIRAQFTIIAAFITSLIIILIIYDSNRQTLQAKIANADHVNSSQKSFSESATLDLMEFVQKLLNDLNSDPNNYDLIVQAGNAFFDIGQYNQAIQYYKKANNIKPTTEILIDLGVCYFNLGQLDSALVTMNKGIQYTPDHKQGLYNLGIVLYNLGDYEGAISKWNQLIKAHPNTAETIRVQQYIKEIKDLQTGT